MSEKDKTTKNNQFGQIKQLGEKRSLVFGEMSFDPDSNVWRGNDRVLAIFHKSELKFISKNDFQALPENMKLVESGSGMTFDEKTNQWKGNDDILLQFEVSEEGELQVSPVNIRDISTKHHHDRRLSLGIKKVRVKKPNRSASLDGEDSRVLLHRFKESLDEKQCSAIANEDSEDEPKTTRLVSSEDDFCSDIQIPKDPNWTVTNFKLVQQDEENWYFELNESSSSVNQSSPSPKKPDVKVVKEEEWSDVDVPEQGLGTVKNKHRRGESKDVSEDESWSDVDVSKLRV